MILRRFAPYVPIVCFVACSTSTGSSQDNNGPGPDPTRGDAGQDSAPPYPVDHATTAVVGLDVEDFRPTLGMSLERVHILAKVDGQVGAEETVDLRSGGALPHQTLLQAPQGKKDAAIELTVEGFVPQGMPGPPPAPNVVRLVSTHFVPFLLHAAHIARGMRVLDIAAGTGLAAEAALGVVGPAGHVTAADLSPAMVEKARARLGNANNVSVAVEDGQALSFSDKSFDAVVCSLGLMFFPDPLRGLAEFRRVLRPGGRAAVSVNTLPGRSLYR